MTTAYLQMECGSISRAAVKVSKSDTVKTVFCKRHGWEDARILWHRVNARCLECRWSRWTIKNGKEDWSRARREGRQHHSTTGHRVSIRELDTRKRVHAPRNWSYPTGTDERVQMTLDEAIHSLECPF